VCLKNFQKVIDKTVSAVYTVNIQIEKERVDELFY